MGKLLEIYLLAFHNSLVMVCMNHTSLLITRFRKSYTVGEELILPASREVLHTVLHKHPEQIIKDLLLHDNFVERRVGIMSGIY